MEFTGLLGSLEKGRIECIKGLLRLSVLPQCWGLGNYNDTESVEICRAAERRRPFFMGKRHRRSFYNTQVVELMPEKPKSECCSVPSGEAGSKGSYNRQKYKSEICKYWEIGDCPYGKKCIFAHGAEERRNIFRHKRLYKTKDCATWSCQHYCPYGTKCQFAHSHASTDVPLWAHCVSILTESSSPGRRLSVFQRLCSVN